MKYYVITGETSGDQHMAEVMRSLKTLDTKAKFRGIGGEDCIGEGLDPLLHQKELAFMGIVEVLKNLRKVRKVIKDVKIDILEFKPDAVILVDYPGFNLRIAQFTKRVGIPVHYYIAPKAWAWNEKRVKKIKAYVDHLYCILPFEESYFRSHGIKSQYVGNPSAEKIKKMSANPDVLQELNGKNVIALLPGSRAQEINRNLEIMLSLKPHFPDHVLAVAQAPGFDSNYYLKFDKDLFISSDMHQLLKRSDAALVCSGTATLETALHNVPQVVCYKTSGLTYKMAKLLVKIPYIALVNIIMNKEVVKELIQDDFNTNNCVSELNKILNQKDKVLKGYELLVERIGDKDPTHEVASAIRSSMGQ